MHQVSTVSTSATPPHPQQHTTATTENSAAEAEQWLPVHTKRGLPLHDAILSWYGMAQPTQAYHAPQYIVRMRLELPLIAHALGHLPAEMDSLSDFTKQLIKDMFGILMENVVRPDYHLDLVQLINFSPNSYSQWPITNDTFSFRVSAHKDGCHRLTFYVLSQPSSAAVLNLWVLAVKDPLVVNFIICMSDS